MYDSIACVKERVQTAYNMCLEGDHSFASALRKLQKQCGASDPRDPYHFFPPWLFIDLSCKTVHLDYAPPFWLNGVEDVSNRVIRRDRNDGRWHCPPVLWEIPAQPVSVELLPAAHFWTIRAHIEKASLPDLRSFKGAYRGEEFELITKVSVSLPLRFASPGSSPPVLSTGLPAQLRLKRGNLHLLETKSAVHPPPYMQWESRLQVDLVLTRDKQL